MIIPIDNSPNFINNENTMKITVYTITECQFSKLEKEYLSSHGLQFEEKNVSTNREFLTEMLTVGSNFAGTPVTKIDTDDGKTVVLKGFTKEEFDKALGFVGTPPAEAKVAETAAPVQAQVAPASVEQSSVAPAAVQPVAPAVEVVPTQPAPVADPAIASILNNLEQQAQQAPAPVEQQPVATAPQQPPVAGQPIIPDPQF